jgi:hypothetical protein
VPLPALDNTRSVRAFARTLLGWTGQPLGTSQVMAVSAQAGVVIAINDHAPRSPVDFFTLRLARALTDAVLLTGRIVRMEPHLRVNLEGPGENGLRALRAELGKPPHPEVGILTRGGGLDLDHPIFSGPGPVSLLVPSPSPQLIATATARGVGVRPLPQPGIQGAIAALDAENVSVEAGITTASALHPGGLDHLILSTFHGPLDPRARGPVFEVDLSQLEAVAAPRTVIEDSGRWTFQLLRRAQSP